MASLFLARRTGAAGFSRDVAIKVVHPDLANDAQFRQMFLDEALLSSRIHHPNVGHVEELGEHRRRALPGDGVCPRLLPGAAAARAARAWPPTAPAFAVRIAMHVAEGLHAAHETLR